MESRFPAQLIPPSCAIKGSFEACALRDVPRQ
jgi:hypothetical protein